MNGHDYLPTRYFRLIKQFLILLIGGTIIYFLCPLSVLQPNTKKTIQQTSCFVISKKLAVKRHFMRHFRADFLISYHVKEVQYTRWVSGNGFNLSFTQNKQEQDNLLSQFQTGVSYPCWYETKNPRLVMLKPQGAWHEIPFRRVLFSVFVLICCLILIKLLGYLRLSIFNKEDIQYEK